MSSTALRRAILVLLPFIDVLTEIGIASAFPQLRAAYGSALRASVVVAVSPLFAVLTGWLWGAIARRTAIGRVVAGAMVGWAVVTIILGLVFTTFLPALILRALQGTFSAGFAALPFIIFARHASGEHERTKSFGTLETSVSAGAIIAPVSVGAVLAVAPQVVLPALGGVMLFSVVLWLRGAPIGSGSAQAAGAGARAPSGSPAGVAPRPGGEIPPGTVVARRVLVPTVFAAGIALALGAFETLIPTVVEDTFGSVLGGKAVTMAFELTVVAGILLKARRPGVRATLPLVLAAVVGTAYLVAVWPASPNGAAAVTAAVAALMVLAGFPVGAAVTMGNEYAAARVEGAEDVGMGLYSTLRITGSFLGPLFMNIPYPAVLAALAAVALACASLRSIDATPSRPR